MPTPIAYYLTIIGILLVAAILLGRASASFGVPTLLAFVGLGMLAGENGLGGIVFNNYRLSFDLGIAALVLILFDGGFNTPLPRVREGLVPALILATAGVVGTAGLVGLAVHLLFPFTWTEALLVGSIISPTDAALIFSVLGRAGVQLKKRVGLTLELESGLNDPMAVLLVTMLTQSLVENRPTDIPAAILNIGGALAGGAVLGAIGGWLSWKLLVIARPPAAALFPVLSAAAAFLTFGLTTLVGGSGLVATYVMAVIVGNVALPYRSGIRRVHDSLTWLAQLVMFLLLGLLARPAAGIHLALAGLGVAVIALLARPLVTFVCLAPLRWRLREINYVGAIGLRGAVPIILAIYPVMERVAGAHEIFDVVFFAVLVNAISLGVVAGPLARKLGLASDQPPAPPAMLEIVSSRRLRGGDFMAFTIERSSAVCGARVLEIPLPAEVSILLLIRDDEVIAPRGEAVLSAGDHVYLFCKPADSAFVRLIFGLPESD